MSKTLNLVSFALEESEREVKALRAENERLKAEAQDWEQNADAEAKEANTLRTQVERLEREKAEAVKLLKQGTWSTTCDCGDCWQCRTRAYLSTLDAPSKPACSYCGRPLPREGNAYCCACGCEYPAAILPESKPVCPDCNGTGIEGGKTDG